jgi:hypothetical protein
MQRNYRDGVISEMGMYGSEDRCCDPKNLVDFLGTNVQKRFCMCPNRSSEIIVADPAITMLSERATCGIKTFLKLLKPRNIRARFRESFQC